MSKKILIIDDDYDLVSTEKYILTEKGYKVFTAKTGAEGFIIAIDEQPDLIILDIMMSDDSDGLDIAIKLKKEEKTSNIPVMIQTGIRKTEHLLNSYASNEEWSNVKGIYEKPFKPELLLKVVEENFK